MNYDDWKNDNASTARQYAAEYRSQGKQIDLRMTDLSGADLSEADLSVADLRWADLSHADLRGAGLRWADLSHADLRWADLSVADLRWADLSHADLRWADLSHADLSHADLRGADGPFTLGAFGRHGGIAVGGYITIGCERHTYDEWLERYEEIGKKHNYTNDEIADYGAWIQLAVARQQRIEGTTD